MHCVRTERQTGDGLCVFDSTGDIDKVEWEKGWNLESTTKTDQDRLHKSIEF